jgi:hypothetical protein
MLAIAEDDARLSVVGDADDVALARRPLIDLLGGFGP